MPEWPKRVFSSPRTPSPADAVRRQSPFKQSGALTRYNRSGRRARGSAAAGLVVHHAGGQQLAQAHDLVTGLGQDACEQGIFVLESLDATLTTIFRLSHTKIVDFCACLWRHSLKINQINTFVRTHHTPPGPKTMLPAAEGLALTPLQHLSLQCKSVSYRCCDRY